LKKILFQRVGALISVRTASTRLPQKALKKICGKETIALLIERIQQCRYVDPIILCTTHQKEDDVLETIAVREGIECFRGADKNVALRLLQAAQKYNLDHFARITGDDTLRDIGLIDEAIVSHLKENADYTGMEKMVYGCETEIVSIRALETIIERASSPENTEYLTWYLEDTSVFKKNYISVPVEYQKDYRLTLDTQEDFELMTAIYEALYTPLHPIDLNDVIFWLDKHPNVAEINRNVKPKNIRHLLDLRLNL